MDREQVVKKMADYLTKQFICSPDEVPEDECIMEAEGLLNLCYDCKDCGGSGKFIGHPDGIKKCPTCKCTGKGLPILAILAEKQELPKQDLTRSTLGDWYKDAQQDMATPDSEGYAFRRVFVGKE